MVIRKNKKAVFLICNIIFLGLFFSFSVAAQDKNMAFVKGGIFSPFYGGDTNKVVIEAFKMDVYPVTNEEFLNFVKQHPKWRKSKAIKLFVDKNYLSQFKDDLHLVEGLNKQAPVTNISWFAAKAYCDSQGKRLPTIAEWEYVAMANKTQKDARDMDGYNQFILRWYEKHHSHAQPVGSTFKNYWGVWDMHGLVWEWTADYNSIIVSTDTRGGGNGVENQFVCGGASINSADPSDYAAFMRYAFRSSLEANYSIKNLGFRCVKEVK